MPQAYILTAHICQARVLATGINQPSRLIFTSSSPSSSSISLPVLSSFCLRLCLSLSLFSSP